MSQLSIKHPVRVVLGAAAALLLFTSAGDAQRGGPFAHLPGTWGGPGMITLNTGVKEKIRCRSVYKVAETGTDLQLELRCAGDAYKFELKGAVESRQRRRDLRNLERSDPRRSWYHLRHVEGQSDQSASQQPDLLGDAGRGHPKQPAIDLDPVSGQRDLRGCDQSDPRREVTRRLGFTKIQHFTQSFGTTRIRSGLPARTSVQARIHD